MSQLGFARFASLSKVLPVMCGLLAILAGVVPFFAVGIAETAYTEAMQQDLASWAKGMSVSPSSFYIGAEMMQNGAVLKTHGRTVGLPQDVLQLTVAVDGITLPVQVVGFRRWVHIPGVSLLWCGLVSAGMAALGCFVGVAVVGKGDVKCPPPMVPATVVESPKPAVERKTLADAEQDVYRSKAKKTTGLGSAAPASLSNPKGSPIAQSGDADLDKEMKMGDDI